MVHCKCLIYFWFYKEIQGRNYMESKKRLWTLKQCWDWKIMETFEEGHNAFYIMILPQAYRNQDVLFWIRMASIGSYFKTWSSIGGTIWKVLGGSIVERSASLGWALRLKRLTSFSPCGLCFLFVVWDVVSQLMLPPTCLLLALMLPWWNPAKPCRKPVIWHN